MSLEEQVAEYVDSDSEVLVLGREIERFARNLADVSRCSVTQVVLEPNEPDFGLTEQVMFSTSEAGCDTGSSHHLKDKFDVAVLVHAVERVIDANALLDQVTKFIKTDAKIVALIPNASNYEVVSKQLIGTFDYTRSLLVHPEDVRFFGQKDLYPLFAKSALGITHIEYVQGGLSESSSKSPFGRPDEQMVKALARSVWSYVRYFIVVAQNVDSLKVEDIELKEKLPIKVPELPANLFYASKDEGFSADRCIKFSYSQNEVFSVSVDISQLSVSQIRFDPVEGFECVIEELSVIVDGAKLEPVAHNGYHILDGYVFPTLDPQLVYDVPEGASTIDIVSRNIIAYGQSGEDFVRWSGIVARKLKREARTMAALQAESKQKQAKIEEYERREKSVRWMTNHLVELTSKRLRSSGRHNDRNA